MAVREDRGTNSAPSAQTIQNMVRTSGNVLFIAQQLGMDPAALASTLQGMGYNVQGGVILSGGPASAQAPSSSTPKPPPGPTAYVQGGRPANVYSNTPTPASQQGRPKADPGVTTNPNTGSGGGGGGGYNYGIGIDPNQTAALNEKIREFDVTTARDIAKQNATEVDSLQQRLAALSGPKDAYADYFFSHGLLPPQGYKPAPVPLTQAQIDAYGKMGTTPQQLQTMISGNGQPGASFGMLGNLGSSLQTPAGIPQPVSGQAPTQAQAPANPTVPGGALYGKTPPGGTNVPTTPGGVPSMAVGGEVPGTPGTPTLAVLHGGEEVTPAPGGQDVTSTQPPQTPGMMNNPGLHPAIAALVDAVSGLLSNPDFRPFVAAAAQSSQATPGGVQSMATGGTVQPGGMGGFTPNQYTAYQDTGRNPLTPNSQGGLLQATPQTATPTSSASLTPQSPTQMGLGRPQATLGGGGQPLAFQGGAPTPPTSGLPLGGAQSVNYNTGAPSPADNPIMPLANMDPYTRALYDVHGRLRPYSAQQEQQMGPQGLDAVSSYVSKVQGGDIKAYQDLVNRLKPQGGAPSASNSTATEGFSFG